MAAAMQQVRQRGDGRLDGLKGVNAVCLDIDEYRERLTHTQSRSAAMDEPLILCDELQQRPKVELLQRLIAAPVSWPTLSVPSDRCTSASTEQKPASRASRSGRGRL